MEKIVKNLTKIASSLDNQKRIKLASQVDKFADALLQIKTAQYVGVQGYWIRNERCWSNCYRQKRAEAPKKASQVVWQECQNEYVESINNPTSGWEKYAQDEKQMKFSEADQKIIKAEQDYFRETVAKKVGNGMFPTVAVYDTIEQRKAKYVKDQIKLANSMLQFAEDMGQNGFKKEAKSLAAEASELIKEAGFFNDMWQGMKGKGEDYRRMNSNFVDKLKTLQFQLDAMSKRPQDVTNKHKQYIRSVYNKGRDELQSYENQAASGSPFASGQVKKIQRKWETEVLPIITSVVIAKNPAEVQQAASQGVNSLGQILQKHDTAKQQAELGTAENPVTPEVVEDAPQDQANATVTPDAAKAQQQQAPAQQAAPAASMEQIMQNINQLQPQEIQQLIQQLQQELNSRTQQVQTSGWEGLQQQPAQTSQYGIGSKNQQPAQFTQNLGGKPLAAKSYFRLVK